MYTLTAADFADTGQWRLHLRIGEKGLVAMLENTLHPEIPLQQLCKVEWEDNNETLRKKIEEAVYNNPRLLDDFATRIVIDDPRTLFVPTSVAEESAGAEEREYQKIYLAETEDIMTDRDGDITAVWSLAPGLKSFLSRSFPGARVSCNLLEKVREYKGKTEGPTLYADTRDDEADLVMIERGDLISASTHTWREPADVAALAMNLLSVYGYKPENVSIIVSGFKQVDKSFETLEKRAGNFSWRGCPTEES